MSPLYEYRCECGNIAEYIIPLKDRNISHECQCGGELKRNISVPTLDTSSLPYAGQGYRSGVIQALGKDAKNSLPKDFNNKDVKKYCEKKGLTMVDG